jgi:hypothetical protein
MREHGELTSQAHGLASLVQLQLTTNNIAPGQVAWFQL